MTLMPVNPKLTMLKQLSSFANRVLLIIYGNENPHGVTSRLSFTSHPNTTAVTTGVTALSSNSELLLFSCLAVAMEIPNNPGYFKWSCVYYVYVCIPVHLLCSPTAWELECFNCRWCVCASQRENASPVCAGLMNYEHVCVHRVCESLFSLDKNMVLLLNKSPFESSLREKWTPYKGGRDPDKTSRQ